MENTIKYKVSIRKIELEESDVVAYEPGKDGNGKEWTYVKTGAKQIKEKESKEIYSQEFETINLSEIVKVLNS